MLEKLWLDYRLDVINQRKKKKSAFYNCFVIYRIKINGRFKEIHVKIFNTGKLEIPGFKMIMNYIIH